MTFAFLQWLSSPATIDNIGAGLIVMAIELTLILFLINRVVTAAQHRAEHRKWRRARAVILVSITKAANNFSLITLTGYRGFPWPPIGDYWAQLERAAQEPAVLDFRAMAVAVRDIERDAAALREALGLYSAALPPEWFERTARILENAVIAGRVSNNLQTSGVYDVMADLPPLPLHEPFEDDHFAPLDAMDGPLAPGKETRKARLLRRWMGLVATIIRLNVLTQELCGPVSKDILRRLPPEDRQIFERQSGRLPALQRTLEAVHAATDAAYLHYADISPDEVNQRRSV